MISVIEHIEYLTIHHDFVVVPGWGALIAQYTPSRVNVSTGNLSRPVRSFSFNSAVNHNDGLLAQSIVRREGVTFDEATSLIAVAVTTCREQLFAGNRVRIANVGSFVMGKDNRVVFEPVPSTDISLDNCYGLGNVTLEPIFATRRVAKSSLQHVFSPVVKRVARVAAAVAVLVLLAVALTTPLPSVNPDLNYAGLNLPSATTPPDRVGASMWDDVNIPLTIAEPQQGRYYLVVVTMSSREQAELYIATNPAIASMARVVARGNTWRVYVDRSDNAADLYKRANSLPVAYRSCWVGE